MSLVQNAFTTLLSRPWLTRAKLSRALPVDDLRSLHELALSVPNRLLLKNIPMA
jgi:hypothetical protein